MLDFVGRLDTLSTELPVHLLLSHLSLNEAPIESQELIVMFDKFECHLVVKGLVSQLLVLLSDTRNKEQVLQTYFRAFFELQ